MLFLGATPLLNSRLQYLVEFDTEKGVCSFTPRIFWVTFNRMAFPKCNFNILKTYFKINGRWFKKYVRCRLSIH